MKQILENRFSIPHARLFRLDEEQLPKEPDLAKLIVSLALDMISCQDSLDNLKIAVLTEISQEHWHRLYELLGAFECRILACSVENLWHEIESLSKEKKVIIVCAGMSPYWGDSFQRLQTLVQNEANDIETLSENVDKKLPLILMDRQFKFHILKDAEFVSKRNRMISKKNNEQKEIKIFGAGSILLEPSDREAFFLRHVKNENFAAYADKFNGASLILENLIKTCGRSNASIYHIGLNSYMQQIILNFQRSDKYFLHKVHDYRKGYHPVISILELMQFFNSGSERELYLADWSHFPQIKVSHLIR